MNSEYTQNFNSDQSHDRYQTKNKNVSNVQFVIQTEAIKLPEKEVPEERATEKLNLWQKFLNLFQK